MPGFISLSDQKIEELEARGDAISVGPDGIVPQLHAGSFDEYLSLVDEYTRHANQYKVSCLLRGQNATYFGADGHLDSSPAANRSSAANTPFHGITDSTAVAEQLGPWLYILDDLLNIDIGNCLRYTPLERGVDYGIARFLPPSVLTGDTSSLVLEAILQHYGFPTYSLDVTTSPTVAAWFALNKASRDEQGEIKFAPLTANPADARPQVRQPQDLASIPAVLVYLQPMDKEDWPVVDLCHNEELRRVAARPVAQEAFSMPFLITQVDQPSDGLRVLDQQCGRCPAAVIKLHFEADELRRTKPEVTSDYLLPPDDPLYLHLINAKAPHLAIYHSERRPALAERPLTPQSWPPPRKRQRGGEKRRPRPGSVAENPKATKVMDRAEKLLTKAGIEVHGSSVSKHDVIFMIDDPKAIPMEVQTALIELAEWGGVAIHCGKAGDDDQIW